MSVYLDLTSQPCFHRVCNASNKRATNAARRCAAGIAAASTVEPPPTLLLPDVLRPLPLPPLTLADSDFNRLKLVQYALPAAHRYLLAIFITASWQLACSKITFTAPSRSCLDFISAILVNCSLICTVVLSSKLKHFGQFC